MQKFFSVLFVYFFCGCSSLKPMINDITTDFENPPPLYENTKVFPVQNIQKIKQHYPTILTKISPLSQEKIATIVIEIINAHTHLTLVHVDPEQRYIYFIAKSKMMGFIDDITERISTVASNTKIDVRSASRVGLGDFGVNAERIQWLFEEIDKKTKL